MFFLALIGVEGDAAAEVGGGFLEQIPLGTLMMYRAGELLSLALMLTALKLRYSIVSTPLVSMPRVMLAA